MNPTKMIARLTHNRLSLLMIFYKFTERRKNVALKGFISVAAGVFLKKIRQLWKRSIYNNLSYSQLLKLDVLKTVH